MNCCAECFGDRGLRKSIIPLRSTEVGKCSYCATDNVPILAPAKLSEYFELLVSAYRKDAGGKLLVQWFREDWGMFEHQRMDDSRAKDLLSEILDDGEIVRQTFSPAKDREADRLGEWEKLRDELMYHNRFFPEVNIDLERLEELLCPPHLGCRRSSQFVVPGANSVWRDAISYHRDGRSAEENCFARPGQSCRYSLSLPWIDTSHCYFRN